MKKVLKKTLNYFGYEVSRLQNSTCSSFPADFTEREIEIIERVRPFTMTKVERIVSLIRAVDYLTEYNIPGDFIECGVWRGGSIMAMALALKENNSFHRKLFLYDTFQGMTNPTEHDIYRNGMPAKVVLNEIPINTGMWCYASYEEVKDNVLTTGYPAENFCLVKGRVEDTLPAILPDRIALLRLDTDWYESTKHTLYHLYPLLSQYGVLILDDYGCWNGAKKATDEFIKEQRYPLFLSRIDYAGRLVIKA